MNWNGWTDIVLSGREEQQHPATKSSKFPRNAASAGQVMTPGAALCFTVWHLWINSTLNIWYHTDIKRILLFKILILINILVIVCYFAISTKIISTAGCMFLSCIIPGRFFQSCYFTLNYTEACETWRRFIAAIQMFPHLSMNSPLRQRMNK